MNESFRQLVLEAVGEVISWGTSKCNKCKNLDTCEDKSSICLIALEVGLKEIYIRHRLDDKRYSK